MIFHLGFELPSAGRKQEKVLDESTPVLTEGEAAILRTQIRKNSRVIQDYVDRIDLLVNKEAHPSRNALILQLRGRMDLLMEENDTFRLALWKFENQSA